MEEVRATAMTYYANMSIGQKQAVQNFYKSLDANGDGKVTSQEYLDALRKAGLNQTSLPSNLFQVLDENNDGTAKGSYPAMDVAPTCWASISCASNVTALVRRRRSTSAVHVIVTKTSTMPTLTSSTTLLSSEPNYRRY
ncbi:hypothetical protein RHGRI_011878 [Rhododendron griersonianum]|uniref:EF-hand domain-containing protein n=1 Tax=Rhododendron griersonianum TaxID=479676 RepID=A0AAV6KP00_9ERIC|nr:hypothetical protein RHGRI_011878 [Rhododendron griersonianum]